MKTVEVVAAIIKYNDLILCCQRKANKLPYLSEKWEFPGGKIEDNETKEQAIIREIKEELEMQIFNLDFILTVKYEYADFKLIMHTFFAQTKQNKFLLHAHKTAVWSPLNEIDRFDWAAADLPIVQFLQNSL